MQRTPQRFAKAVQLLTQGYNTDAIKVIKNAIFDVETNKIVIVRDINVASLREHHLLPLTSKAHIGYVPSKEGKVLDLSRLARRVELSPRRLQIQGRPTTEVANAAQKVVKADGVMMMMECEHMCMTMRGFQQPVIRRSHWVRQGDFENNKDICERFWAMLNGPRLGARLKGRSCVRVPDRISYSHRESRYQRCYSKTQIVLVPEQLCSWDVPP